MFCRAEAATEKTYFRGPTGKMATYHKSQNITVSDVISLDIYLFICKI